jgi:hypothetical protein
MQFEESLMPHAKEVEQLGLLYDQEVAHLKIGQ